MNSRTCLILGALLGMASAQPAWASFYRVEINTSAIQGSAGAIAFNFTSNNASVPNTAFILDFSHNGMTGLPETRGGLVQGDIILLLNPAPFTEIGDDFFFNELVVPFTSFGSRIGFSVQVTEAPPAQGDVPDEFSFFILGPNRQTLFSSADPLGANSLFAICIEELDTSVLRSFPPTAFTPPDLLNIFASGPGPLYLFTNQVNFSSSDWLFLSLAVNNPGVPLTVDFLLGVLLPDLDTIVFFTDLALTPAVGSLSNPSSFRPIVSNVNLSVPFNVNVADFFSYRWTGGEPGGTYVFFLAATAPGAFLDGVVSPGDILFLQTAPLTFIP